MTPAIAVVTSNYNHAHYLPEAIESVVGQVVRPQEFVIVDDASTDNSVEVIERYARLHPWIKLVRQSRNRGGIHNVNAVIPTLQSTHMISLAADDRLQPGFLAAAKAFLEAHPEAGLCLCDFEVFHDDGRRYERRLRLAPHAAYFPPHEVAGILYNSWPHGQSIVQIAALREVGLYQEDLRWHCDWFASWAICARYGFGYLPIIGTALRASETSYSGEGRRGEQQKQVLARLIERISVPANAPLCATLREANALSHFGVPIITPLRRSPRGRELLTWKLLSSVVCQWIYLSACRLAPRAMKDWIKRRL